MTYPVPQPALLTAVTILDAALTGVLVSPKMPRTRPAQFVRVSLVGGDWRNIVTDAPRILVECWATTVPAVETLTNQARAAMRNAEAHTIDGVFVRCWDDEQGPVDFPDPDVTDMERWQFHGSLYLSVTPGS